MEILDKEIYTPSKLPQTPASPNRELPVAYHSRISLLFFSFLLSFSFFISSPALTLSLSRLSSICAYLTLNKQ